MRSIPASLPKSLVLVAILTIFAVVCPVPLTAQETTAEETSTGQAAATFARPLITAPLDESQLTVLKGNTYPLARREFDLGAAPASRPMQRMLLVLKRSPEQEFALRKLLDDQQDKGSPNYHKWLTPEQFGKQFGPTDADMQTITGWLQSHGFQVGTTKGRSAIEFSGSASQVQEAFHTSIHKYIVNGEQYWANASDPQIPTALTPAVAGVFSLHNFLSKPQYRLSPQKGTVKLGPPPQVTFSDGTHALGPGDYAVIYNIKPVYNTPITGSGVTIAVIGRSQIQLSDYTDFQNAFGFSSNVPNIIVNGSDPGDVPGDDLEGTLDATWSQAIAPGATVDFVVSATTDVIDGIVLSEFYIVENNLASVMTESFSTCEAGAGDAEVAGVLAFAEQAAAQGITYTVSAGDTGAEGCDNLGETVAAGPISVNLFASTPFTVGVGGTIFNEHGQDATYWSSNTTQAVTALSYIPEDVWNESCPASTCGFNANIAAGGGGASLGNVANGGTFAGFPKPSWQAKVTGIPSDGKRDVPDVSLTAALHDAYLLCFQGSCAQGFVLEIGGTSASAPSFAGIMALVDQRMGQVEPTIGTRQGQADYILYPLAAAGNANLSKCNGSSTTLPLASCIFNDATVGNNDVPGEKGFPNGPYNSTTGYDPASGLGSVDVASLVNAWASAIFRPTTTTLGLNPTTGITHGQAVSVTINVAASSGTGTPAGDVSLIAKTGSSLSGQTAVDRFTLSNGATPPGSTTLNLPGGTYQVFAHYAGNSTSTPTGTFAPSDSNTVTVTVSPQASTTTMAAAQTFSLSGQQLSLAPLNSGTGYGNLVYLSATVAGMPAASGLSFSFPTGSITFADANGDPPIPGNPYALNSAGNAVTPLGLFTLPVGQYSVTANYSSDASFNASSSNPALAFSISQAATSTTVSPSATTISPGGSITLNASIATGTATIPSFGAAPTGTVSFFSSGTLVGTAQPVIGTAGTASFLASLLTPSSATASLTTTALPTGSDSITATYTGDSNYATSTSPAVTVTVQPDFTLPAAGLGTVVVSAPGGMGTVNLSITPGTGFNAAVSFTCTSGLPAESACLTGTIAAGQTTGTMTVTTTGPHMVMLGPSQQQNYYALWTMGSGFALGGVFLLGAPRRRRWTVLLSLMVFALLVTLPACGGGGGGGGHQDPGTPVGMTTVNVTATSGSLSHTTTFVLNVQ